MMYLFALFLLSKKGKGQGFHSLRVGNLRSLDELDANVIMMILLHSVASAAHLSIIEPKA